MKMTWTVTNLVIQIIAGILGGHVAAAAAKEHSFGAFGHTVAGAVGGALSGYFLQGVAATMVDVNGNINDVSAPTQWMLQSLSGLMAGAAATLIVGFVKHSIDHHKAGGG
jgi:uncharacterized membrane protein YeaQ/YmgE (transglycosylase-associated protein family)